MAYKPFDSDNDWINKGTAPSLASGPVVDLRRNSDELLALKYLRRGDSYYIGPTTGSTDITVIDGDNFIGHYDSELADNNPETIGLQFSTHPGSPQMVPFGWFPSAMARGVKIRIACKVENAPVDIVALGLVSKPGVDIFLPGGPTHTLDALSFASPDGTDWDATKTCWVNYNGCPTATIVETSVAGTGGISYHELELTWEIDTVSNIERAFADSIVIPGNGNLASLAKPNVIALLFSSRVDETSSSSTDIVDITVGRKVIEITNRADTLDYGPGKYHKMMKITDGAQDPTTLEYVDTWHHVQHARPHDPSETFWQDTNLELVIWPRIPDSANPTSIAPGEAVTLYDVGKISLYSVTFEEILY